jgi:hypothetical protein
MNKDLKANLFPDDDDHEDSGDSGDLGDLGDIEATELTREDILDLFNGGSHTGNSMDQINIESTEHIEVLTIAQSLLRDATAFYLVVEGDPKVLGGKNVSVSSTVNLELSEESEFLEMVQENICGPERDVQLARAIKATNRIGELHGIDLSEIVSLIAVAL